MKFADLIDTRTKALAELEKQFAAKPKADLADRLGKATLEARVGRIEQRIVRLKRQREVTLERIDAALASEDTALAAAKQLIATAPTADQGGAKPARTDPPKTDPIKAKTGVTESVKATVVKAAEVKANPPSKPGVAVRKAVTKPTTGKG